MLNKFTGIKLLILSALFLSNDTKATCFGLFGETPKTSAQPIKPVLPAFTEDQAKMHKQRLEMLDADEELANKQAAAHTLAKDTYIKCIAERKFRLLTTEEVNPEQFALSDLITHQCHSEYDKALQTLAQRRRDLANTEGLDKAGRLQHSTLLSGVATLVEKDKAAAEAKAAEDKAAANVNPAADFMVVRSKHEMVS